MKTKFAAGVLALVLIALLGYRVAAAKNDKPTQAEDRVQIENLMWNYSRALYTQNADAYAALYTPDGQFGTGAHAAKGREAIKKMILNLKQREAGQQPVYVMDLDSHIEFSDRDHARLEAYWLEVSPRTGQKPAQVVNAGREVEEFARIKGQWLIQFRDPAPKD